MLLSPEATVHAEIARRLELADVHRRYRPVRARRRLPRLRTLVGRMVGTPRPPEPAQPATAGRHHRPAAPTAALH